MSVLAKKLVHGTGMNTHASKGQVPSHVLTSNRVASRGDHHCGYYSFGCEVTDFGGVLNKLLLCMLHPARCVRMYNHTEEQRACHVKYRLGRWTLWPMQCFSSTVISVLGRQISHSLPVNPEKSSRANDPNH